MTFLPTKAKELASEYSASLANNTELETGWFDLEEFGAYQLGLFSPVPGLIQIIETSNFQSGGGRGDDIPTSTVIDTFPSIPTLPKRQRYINVKLRNETGVAVANVALTLNAFYNTLGASVFAPSIAPSDFTPAIITQSLLRGRDIHSDWQTVSVNPNGELQTARYIIDAARNEIEGVTKYDQIGKNPDIDTSSAPEDITPISGLYTGFDATVGEAIAVTSTSALDVGNLVVFGTATGGTATSIDDSGATFITNGVAVGDCIINDTQGVHGIVRTVTSETSLTVWRFENEDIHTSAVPEIGDSYRVATTSSTGAAIVELSHCLETDYDGYKTEYVIMKGAGGVNTIGTDYIRNSKSRVVLCGSNGTPQGTIDGTQATTTANVFWNILPTENTAQNALDTVPKGFTLYAWVKCQMARASGAAGSAEMKFLVRPIGEVFEEIIPVDISNSQGYETPQEENVVINEYADFKWNNFDVSDNSTKISAQIDGYLIINT